MNINDKNLSKIIHFINLEIISKHDDIYEVYSYEFPDNMKIKQEFIFKVKFGLTKDNLDKINQFIETNLHKYYNDHNLIPDFMIILSTL